MVLVVLDTTRADALSLYGNPRETSPRLDALAQDAVTFDRAFTVAASTPPSMAALMTGRLPHYDRRLRWNDEVAHGMLRFFPEGRGIGLGPTLPTLAERFRDAGYFTAGVITNPYVKSLYGFDRGFETYREIFRDDVQVYGRADEVVDAGLEALQAAGERRIFLYLHFMDAHEPYLPPEEHRDAIAFEAIPGLDDLTLNRRWVHDARPGDPTASRMAAHARGLYEASVRFIDTELGRLFDAMSASGRLDDALIAVVGDHGEEFLERGSNGHRGTVYDELLHVPLLLRVPDRRPRRVSEPVRHFDLGATLLDLVGLDPFPDAEARSLRPFLRAWGLRPQLEAIGSFPVISHGMPHRLFLRESRFKLIYDVRVPERSELYDLVDDPGEHRNVYEDRPHVAARLANRVQAALEPLEEEWKRVRTPRRRAYVLSDVEELKPARGSLLVPGPEGAIELRAEAEGRAAFSLPLVLFEEPTRARVVLEVETAMPAVVRLLWQEPESPVWHDDRRVEWSVTPGRSTVELELAPPGDVIGRLRIEAEPVPLQLHRLEVLDLSAPEAAGGEDVGYEGERAQIDPATRQQLEALGYVE